MKVNGLIAFILLITNLSYAQLYKSALFFGNSYTYQNNLPNLVSKVAQGKGDTLYTEIQAGGGQRLSGHASDPQSYQKMKSRPWNYIVFQEQSQLPAFPISQVHQDVFPYAEQLCDSVHALPFCSTPLFFMTWGRKNGDQQNCKYYKPLCTYEGMSLELRKNYLQMGYDNNAQVSPVGMVWREIRSNWPNINLYSSDGSHPSLAGSYAAACTFYAVIFNKSPIGSNYNSGLSQQQADSIQKAAHNIVFDSLKTWNIVPDSVDVRFSYSATYDTVQFTNLATAYDSISWDFGNGTNSTQFNPKVVYGQQGNFRVKLIGYKKCKVDSLIKYVSVKPLQPTLKADFNYSVNFDTVKFVYTGTPFDSLKWSFGNGNTSKDSMHTEIYHKADSFVVKLTAYYKNLSDSVSKTVKTKLNTTSLEVFELNKQLVKVYPNPSTGKINVSSNNTIQVIKVMDLSGKVKFCKSFDIDQVFELDLESLFAGLYIIEVQHSSGTEFHKIQLLD